MQNNFVGPPVPPGFNFGGPQAPEKNILINRGIPWNGSSSGPSTGIGGGSGLSAREFRDQAARVAVKSAMANAQRYSSNIDQSYYRGAFVLETEINKEIAAATPHAWSHLNSVEIINQKSSALDELLSNYKNKLWNSQFQANQSYGISTSSQRSLKDLEEKLNQEISKGSSWYLGGIVAQWEASYKAVHEVKLLSKKIDVLTAKKQQLSSDKTHAEHALRVQHAREAARQLAQQQAEEAARQNAQRQAEDAARHLAQQQADAAARHIAQQQADAAASEFARQQAHAAARQIAQQQAETAAREIARQQAAAEQAEAEAIAKAERETEDSKTRAHSTLSSMVAAPYTTPASNVAALALETALKQITLRLLTSAPMVWVPVLAAIYPSDLGDGNLRNTPLSPPGSDALGPTTLPEALPLPPAYPGGRAVPNPSQIETLPGVDPADTNASIPGYPSDEELPSPDVMEARNTPGTASGIGSPSNGTWLGENTRGEGAAIPSQIADLLRGQRFDNFDRLREAIWKAVANDSELSKQFNRINIAQMMQGKSPTALASDQVGQRVKFEIHHQEWIVNGGAVYDMDNLFILVPHKHIETHKPERKL